MPIKTWDDINRDAEKRRREKLKKDIEEDTSDIINGVLKNFDNTLKNLKRDRQKEKKNKIWGILKLILVILILLNFIFANVWLLRFFIKSLFF